MTTHENTQKLWLSCQTVCLLKFFNKFDAQKVATLSVKERQFLSQCTTQLETLATLMHPNLFPTADTDNTDNLTQIALLKGHSLRNLTALTPRRSSLTPKPLRSKNLPENYNKHVIKNYQLINETIKSAHALAWTDYINEKYYRGSRTQEEEFSEIASPKPDADNSTIIQILLHKLSNPTQSMLESISSLKLSISSRYGQNYSRLNRLFVHFQHHFRSILPDTFDSLMQDFKSLKVDDSLRSLQLLEQHKKNNSVTALLLSPATQWQRSLRETVAARPKIISKQTIASSSETSKKNNSRKLASKKSRRGSDLLDYQSRPLTFLKPLAHLVKQETTRLNSCWLLFSCFTGKRTKASKIQSAYDNVVIAASKNKVNTLKDALHLNNSSLIKAFGHRRNIDRKAPISWNNLMTMFSSCNHWSLRFDPKVKAMNQRFN